VPPKQREPVAGRTVMGPALRRKLFARIFPG
jgi:hypothetical protein